MSGYPNIMTPPSSSEDSPQSHAYNSPPSGHYESAMVLPPTSLAFDFGGFAQTTVPYLKILEQPIDRFRFRYKSEMTGTHGSLCGQTSDRSRKQTYPKIELFNFNKRAVVRCSIYQHNTKENHKPHAHRLIKKHGKGEVDDPHDGYVSPQDGFVYTFHSMGIIHTAKKNIVPELTRKKIQLKKEEVARNEGKVRELTNKEIIEIKGLAEAESKSINLNVVCLRFDAFYETNGILLPICPPVFTHTINNLKSALTGELKIVRMDHCTSPAKGGKEVFILVERVTKKNVKIRFFELDDEDNVIWEDYGKFSDLDVHHQYAIVFKTPPYRDLNIKNPVKIYIELERPSDRARSEPKEFSYTPSSGHYKPGQKRARLNYDNSSYDSSLASDELPVPINNLHIECNPVHMLDDALEVTSTELQQAMNNINSDEFQKIFDNFGTDYLLATDAPVKSKGGRTSNNRREGLMKYVVPQMDTSDETTIMAQQAISELQNFMKTHPSDDVAINMLCHYLNIEDKTNALHVSIKQKDIYGVMFLLKMIFVWKQSDLLNRRNDILQTPLHIATSMNLEEIVSTLIICKADVSVGDGDMNTALHVAVTTNASISIFEKLLSVQNVRDFIDTENNDGNTALDLAIETNNLTAFKLLCRHGVDINRQHKKNGFTPLRFIVEKQNVNFLTFVLQHKELNPVIEDFQDVTPFQAALKKENPELVQLVAEYMKLNNYADVEIKTELEDQSDDGFEEKFAVKLEQISNDELRELYLNVKDFSDDCLEELAQILDHTGTWENLAELLDLSHMVKTTLYKTAKSPTKLLLKLAIEVNGDTVVQIRDFLEHLDENQAVEVIDNMVRSLFT